MAKNKKTASKGKGAPNSGKKRGVLTVVCVILAALFLIWTVAGSFMFIYAETASLQEEGTDSMRGVWVATTYNIDYPDKPTQNPEKLKADIDRIVENCVRMGMNAVFFQARSNADACYASSIFPWSKDITGRQGLAPDDGFDPMAYFIEAAHGAGLEFHAWVNPYRITNGGQSQWDSMYSGHPAKNGYSQYVIKYKDNYYFDPSSPEVQQLIVDGVMEILENYDVDGIHMDDYFYPGRSFDDVASYNASGTDLSRDAWRRENVNQLIRTLDQKIHAFDPYCEFGISPSGIWANRSTDPRGSATKGYQHYIDCSSDTYTWIKEGWIDYVVPQIYWPIGYSIADYEILANWWNDVCEGTDVDLYIGMADYRCTESKTLFNQDELFNQLSLNRELPNVGGELHFNYKEMLEAGLDEFYEEVYLPDRYFSSHAYFKDVAGHWAETAVLQLYEQGVVNGMDYRRFGPDLNTTRAQFVKMLAGMAGVIVADGPVETGFSDVPADSWYAPYVKWAADSDIVRGYGDEENRFGPEDYITREQMAVLMVRYFGSSGITPAFQREMISFADTNHVSEWAEESVVFAVRSGLFSGVEISDEYGRTASYFLPFDFATRAQIATVICNAEKELY